MDINRKNKGTFRFIRTLCFILLCVFIILTFSMNHSIHEAEASRDTSFDKREQAREWVTQEVINYLRVVDKSTWKNYSSSSNLDDLGKYQIYGTDFETFKLPSVTKYTVVDVQYTMDEDTNFKVYVNMILEIRGKLRATTFIATIRDNKLSGIEVY